MAGKFLSEHLAGSRFWANVASFVVAILIIGSLVLGTLAVIGIGRSQRVACVQVDKLRGALVTVLENGEAALPHSAYFKAHPDQLAQAEQTYRYDISQLQPISC